MQHSSPGRNPDNSGSAFRHEPQGVELQFATETERAVMKAIRWWTIAELEGSNQLVFPADLATVLGSLSKPPKVARGGKRGIMRNDALDGDSSGKSYALAFSLIMPRSINAARVS
jgi:hypothetical protein